MPLPVDPEADFMRWYLDQASKTGINPNPDDPRHFYDFRGAYLSGQGPNLDPVERIMSQLPGVESDYGHWSSLFKREGHPRMILNDMNTKTGLPASDLWRLMQ
jgi:hypothetical protein